MADEHVMITLTFKTPASTSVVLEGVLTALNKHAMPYELTSANCNAFDLDDEEDHG